MFSPAQQIVFVTGKGGVGKSTVAAALARAEADRGGHAQLVEFEGMHAAARALGAQADGVRTVTVDYLDALSAAIASMISSRLLARVIVRQRTLKRVMQAVPAVRELVALERVRTLAREMQGARVIVDLPATGHAVDWLRVVAAAERFLRTGPAAKMCRSILEEVLSPERSAIVVVSTAEPVVASETGELCERLRSELDRVPDIVIVNRVPRRSHHRRARGCRRQRESRPALRSPFGGADRGLGGASGDDAGTRFAAQHCRRPGGGGARPVRGSRTAELCRLARSHDVSAAAALTVVLGGGGVGKTTTAAALGLAHARAGRRVLVVTVDPARRLADALGVEIGIEASLVEVGGTTLHARMPDSRHSVDRFAEWLFEDPEALRRVQENGMYRELGNSLAGVHELISIAFVDHELGSGLYDEVVLDTAPSRHALEFLDYPARLGRMLEARTLEWVAGLARLAGVALDERPDDRGIVSWGKKRVGNLVSHLVGAQAIRDIGALFQEFVPVRGRWLSLVRSVEQRMQSADTRYVIVSGPSGSSLDDAGYLLGELRARSLAPGEILLNRAVDEIPTWIAGLGDSVRPELAPALDAYRAEFTARALQTRIARERLGELASDRLPVRGLPALRTADPRAILEALAAALAAPVTD